MKALTAIAAIVIAAPCAFSAPQPVTAEQEGTQINIAVDGKPFTVYRFDQKLKKPYLWPVLGPRSGKSVTVESVPDQYPHHNSIWLGCDRVNGGNFWQPHGDLSTGHVKSTGAKIAKGEGDSVVITDECIWQKPGMDAVIRDTRRITISAPSADLRFLDFELEMHMLTDVIIQKTNHSLFSVRMMPDLSAKEGGTLVNARGDVGEKATFGVATPWCAFHGTRDGVTEGVAFFQSPTNPWYPSPWFTRDYGFMSPTPMYWPENDKDTRFAKGDSLILRYRVVVHGGTTDEAKTAALFADYAKDAAGILCKIPDDVLEGVIAYSFGGSRNAVSRVDAIIRRTPPAMYETIEAQLLPILDNPKATVDAKRFVFRKLARIGTNASLPVLVPLLKDAQFAEYARFALTQIGTDKALAALRDAAPAADRQLKLGLIESFGLRADARALPLLSEFARGNDSDLAQAATESLGRIGSAEALAALESAQTAGTLAAASAAARLACAERMTEAGQGTEAAETYKKLLAPGNAKHVRTAAAVGLARSAGKEALPTVTALLADKDPVLREAGISCVNAMPADPAVTAGLCNALGSLPVETQVILLQALGRRGDRAAAPTARALLANEDVSLRMAAAVALGPLGSADDVPALVDWLNRESAESATAQNALAKLTGEGITQALIDALPRAKTSAARLAWVEVIDSRGDPVPGTLLLKLAADDDAKVCREALKVLPKQGTAEEIAGLITLLDSDLGDRTAREPYEVCIAKLCQRHAGDGEASRFCVESLPKAQAPAKASLYAVLGRLADESSLPLLGQAATDKNETICDAAVRALTAWPRDSAFDPLLEVAQSTGNAIHNVLALRACLRLIQAGRTALSDEILEARCEAAEAAARRPEEKALFKYSAVGVRVTDLVVTSKGKYLVHRGGMNVGAKWSTDRDYTFTEIPPEVLGATYIETVMDDRSAAPDQDFMTFAVETPVTVYVAYDHRCRSVPKWLSDWAKTKSILKNTASGSHLVLYRKAFPAGKVVLGGAKADGVAAMYIVCVQPGG